MPTPTQDVESGSLKVVSADDRREIKEFEFGGSAVNDFLIGVKPTGPLGQHFHRKKTETFYVLEGSGTLRTAQVNEEGEIIGEVQEFEVLPGFVVQIPPYHTHRFDLTPGTRFVAHSSKPFESDDMPSCPIE